MGIVKNSSRNMSTSAEEQSSEFAGIADCASEIVDSVRKGDSDGLYKLYGVVRGYHLYFIKKLGFDSAEDATHELFLRTVAAVKRGNLLEPQLLMAFVRGIARNQVFEHIDKLVNRRSKQEDLEAINETRDMRWSVEQSELEKERHKFVQSCLAQLPPRRCEILTRFYLLEQPQERIQREMDLTSTQFRLLKTRSKAEFGRIGRKRLWQSQRQRVPMRQSRAA